MQEEVSVSPHKATVLDYFRASKDVPAIQFLTWYLILVKQWKLEDIASLDITPFGRPAGLDGHVSATFCFVFADGRAEKLVVVRNGEKFYVQSSWSVAQ